MIAHSLCGMNNAGDSNLNGRLGNFLYANNTVLARRNAETEPPWKPQLEATNMHLLHMAGFLTGIPMAYRHNAAVELAGLAVQRGLQLLPVPCILGLVVCVPNLACDEQLRAPTRCNEFCKACSNNGLVAIESSTCVTSTSCVELRHCMKQTCEHLEELRCCIKAGRPWVADYEFCEPCRRYASCLSVFTAKAVVAMALP